MGPYTETTESAAAPVLVLSEESALVPATIRGLDPSPDGVTALSRVQPGEPVAGNLLDGFCEGGWAQEVHLKTCPYPPQVGFELLKCLTIHSSRFSVGFDRFVRFVHQALLDIEWLVCRMHRVHPVSSCFGDA